MVEYPQDTTKTNRITIGAITHNQKIQSINKTHLLRILKTLMVGIEPTTIRGDRIKQ